MKVQVGNSKGNIGVTKRPIQKLYPLKIRTEEPIKQLEVEKDEPQTEIQSCHQRPRRAAALDADWLYCVDSAFDNCFQFNCCETV